MATAKSFESEMSQNHVVLQGKKQSFPHTVRTKRLEGGPRVPLLTVWGKLEHVTVAMERKYLGQTVETNPRRISTTHNASQHGGEAATSDFELLRS